MLQKTAASLFSLANLASKSSKTGCRLFARSPLQTRTALTAGSARRYTAVTNNHSLVQTQSLSFGDLASFLYRSLTKPMVETTTSTTTTACSGNSIFSWAIWLVKRTYQPSLLKKKRQCGYMKRQQSVGGRRILKRRRQKGRKRLFGA